jgi:ribonucleotide reductase alpha subunit
MAWRSNKNPMFRSQFSEDIFNQKYNHTGCETWGDLVRVLAYDVCDGYMAKSDIEQLIQYMSDMKFIPGGRYLYYAGRPKKFFNNCMSYDSLVMTDAGFKRVGALAEAGQSFNVLSPVDGQFYPATAKTYGKQELNLITFAPLRGRSSLRWSVLATANHRWPLMSGEVTDNLQIKDVVPANGFGYNIDDTGFAHGFVFGDGNSNGQLRLCADKDLEHLAQLRKVANSVTYPEFADGNPCLYFNQDIKWKNLPDTNATPEYISGFIRGWIAADGCKVGRVLNSVSKEHMDWFQAYAPYAGLVTTGKLRSQVRDIEIGEYKYPNHEIYIQNFCEGSDFSGFKVEAIEPVGMEDVYCVEEPVHTLFVTDYGMQTGNCYLLKAEEDTREDWADISWKAESCLMTGGGIGVDYTVYRGEGELLKGTGGKASGPVPKIEMINEIGRRVMQGGSRRSAIWASLLHSHTDVMKLMAAKDWNSMMVGTTGYSLGDIKQQDFNFPAPLDMTNISVNYDDDWLLKYWATGDYGDVFLQNVRQALRTGEPGFAFNFFDKRYETLRNAPVAKNTYVMTDKGYVTVDSIINTEVSLWTGKQWAKATFRKTGHNVPTVKVEMTGGRSITCDPSHEFFVIDKHGSSSKVRAESLVPGDNLLVQLPVINTGTLARDSKWYGLGYIYGDGSFCSKYANRAEVTFCTTESKLCADMFNSDDFDHCTTNRNDGRGYIRKYFRDDCFIGMSKERLTMPDVPDSSQTASLLAGLWDSDGNYEPTQRRLLLSSKHKSFLEDVRRLLETIGIQADVSKAGNSTYGQAQMYQLSVKTEYIDLFRKLVPTVRINVPEGVTSYRDAYIKVLSVEDSLCEDVFCCDVGVKEHSFCAEGVIISNCTEVTSEDDSDVCNLGSINYGRIDDISELEDIIRLSVRFLICGTLRAELPYDKVYRVRQKNRRLGLGLMGLHEWLIKRGSQYNVTSELHRWLSMWRSVSDDESRKFASSAGVSQPVANRAIAPTGSIGILAGTTTGIEPVYAVAYKRRYLTNGNRWRFQYVVDSAAQELIDLYDTDPDTIESAIDLAEDYERRIAFQADVQDYVDMAISSTINLPKWGSELNNEDRVEGFAKVLADHAHRLRGFTVYPDGARGGQPLTSVPYKEAVKSLGQEFDEGVAAHDICDISGKGGSCGV